MIPIEFNDADVLRSRIVVPSWYRVRVKKVTEKPSKGGDSKNFWIEGEILFEADNGDKTFAGTPTPFAWLFSEKAMGFAYGFIAAVTGEEPTVGKRYDLEAAEGKELDVFIENDTYNGQIQNKINHKYRAVRN